MDTDTSRTSVTDLKLSDDRNVSDRSQMYDGDLKKPYPEALEGHGGKIHGNLRMWALRVHFENLSNHLSDRSEMKSSSQIICP